MPYCRVKSIFVLSKQNNIMKTIEEMIEIYELMLSCSVSDSSTIKCMQKLDYYKSL